MCRGAHRGARKTRREARRRFRRHAAFRQRAGCRAWIGRPGRSSQQRDCMSRGRRVAGVTVVGGIVGLVAFAAIGASTAALCLLAAGVVIGELLVLRLEDGSAVPLSYAVFIVLASSFNLAQCAAAVIVAEAVALLLRDRDRDMSTRFALLGERLAVAGATFAAYTITIAVLGNDTVAALLTALASAALGQVVVDVSLRSVLQLRSTFSPRGRLAWLGIASSGMLMAVGC